MSAPTILITGAAKRIGAALARHFAQNGWDIALHYNSSESEARALQREIEAMGRACALFAQDLADIPALPAFMAKVKRALPHCEALINNASIFERAGFLDTDETLFDRQMDINFKAPFFLTQAFVRAFNQGSVVNILDTEISNTQGSHFAYLLAKKALGEFTLMAARALGPQVRVNAVCPGITLPSDKHDEAYMAKLAPSLPLRALAQPEQIAQTALWLCQNTSLTGQMIFIDGGQHVL